MNLVDLEHKFFGRESILNLLNRRVVDLKEGYRQNIAFLGKRFSGKSTILRKFLLDLDDEQVIVIYVDLDTKDPYHFYHKIVGSLLYNFSKSKGLPLFDDLSLLTEGVKKHIPQTVLAIQKITQYVNKDKWVEAYNELIALPEIFSVESGKHCVVALDEFHHLEEFGIPAVFQQLGSRIMTQRRCLYIMTSSLNGVAKDILSEKLSLLFGNFEIVEISPFDLRTSQQFVDHNLGGLTISRHLRNFLIDFISGHPFYLSIVCQEIVHLAALHNQKEIFLPMVSQAIENTIFNRWGILSRHFELLSESLCQGKGQRIMPAVLIALANGRLKHKDIADDVQCKKTHVTQRLNRLIDLGIVIKNGTLYYLDDKLYKFWLKYVYQRRLRSLSLGVEAQRLRFRDEIHQLANRFMAVAQKDLPARIVDLLHCFDNEALQMNGRRYKLPMFKEIEPVSFKEFRQPGVNIIRASSDEGDWYIILKEDTVMEGDVSTLLAELKKLKSKPQKRLIISLTDLEVNARLKALQERMWIWSEKELNTLLNLYDKPYILE